MAKKSGISRVARGTTGAAVNVAERQIFSPADKIGPVPEGAPRRSLQQVLCELLESEINAGLQSFAFDNVRVWIGDKLNGIDAKAELTPDDPAWGDDGAIAHWLHETAIRLYPDSDYARVCKAAASISSS